MADRPGSELPALHRVALTDGRSLGYIEVGDPEGYPVVSNHGGLSSRLDVVPADASARAHGLRVISPDRPGIGASDPRPGRTMGDWASDMGELADQLDLDRFAVMGWSFGGCFAQSVGRFLGDRVSVLALIASGIPSDWPGMRDEIDRLDRVLLRLSERSGNQLAARSIFHLMGSAAHRLPTAFAHASGYHGASADALATAIASGLSDPAGVVSEYQAVGAHWGFDPSEIEVPTQLWQGDGDELVPPAWATRLHEAIPGSTLTLVPGATHFLWYDQWDAIFDAITGVVRARPDQPPKASPPTESRTS